MSDRNITNEDVSRRTHRHMWFVAGYETAVNGRTREKLRCRKCDARKGRYLKASRTALEHVDGK